MKDITTLMLDDDESGMFGIVEFTDGEKLFMTPINYSEIVQQLVKQIQALEV